MEFTGMEFTSVELSHIIITCFGGLSALISAIFAGIAMLRAKKAENAAMISSARSIKIEETIERVEVQTNSHLQQLDLRLGDRTAELAQMASTLANSERTINELRDALATAILKGDPKR